MKCTCSSVLARAAVLFACVAALCGCITLEFSPDGRQLLFMWQDAGSDKQALARIDADGANLRVVSDSVEGMFGHWSPNGEFIVFTGEKGIKLHKIADGSTRILAEGEYGDTCWADSDTLIAYKGPLITLGNEVAGREMQWIKIATGEVVQRVPFQAGDPTSPLFMRPAPKTNGVLFASDANLYIAEFGGVRRITTTGDLAGFALMPGNEQVLFARRSANSKYILLSLYEYDLGLRKVKKRPFPNHVPGINPKPRVGPDKVEAIFFSPDLSRMIVHTDHELPAVGKQPTKRYTEIFVVATDGSSARRVFSGDPRLSKDEGAIAVWNPSGSRIGMLLGSTETLKIGAIDPDGANRKIFRTMTAKPKSGG